MSALLLLYETRLLPPPLCRAAHRQRQGAPPLSHGDGSERGHSSWLCSLVVYLCCGLRRAVLSLSGQFLWDCRADLATPGALTCCMSQMQSSLT